MDGIVFKAVILALLFFSVMVHEVAHAAAAFLCGDTTARDAGRLSFNPIKHIDPIGTIILPLFLIFTNSGFWLAWAKPVPIDLLRMKNIREGLLFTSLAGPASNFLLSLAGVALIKLGLVSSAAAQGLTVDFIFMNVMLMVFNLFPIPPLDGSRMVTSVMPARLAAWYMRLEPVGFLIIIILVMTDFFPFVFRGIMTGYFRVFLPDVL